MRQSQTAVLERNTTYTGDRGEVVTEPFEAAWAAEGRWFVQTLAATDGAGLRLRTEISPDGLTWCPLEDTVHETGGAGLVSWPVTGFGGWLRLRGTLAGPDPSVTVRIYLAVKS